MVHNCHNGGGGGGGGGGWTAVGKINCVLSSFLSLDYFSNSSHMYCVLSDVDACMPYKTILE